MVGMAAWYCARRANIRGVGPAGRALRALRVRGRRKKERSIGGRRRVGGNEARRKDCDIGKLEGSWERMRAYSEFARAPKSFNNTEMVDCHCGEEKGGRIRIAALNFPWKA